MTVPRTFHFVFGLRPQSEPFHLVHYLCLESCRQVNKPDRILFHYHNEPWGPWWERIRPHLELHPVEPETFVRDHDGYYEHEEGRFIQGWDLSYAHQADFLRLRTLIEHGGVYADMDTLFLRPLPDSYYQQSFLIGEEDLSGVAVGATAERSLCNAFMVSAPGSRFAQEWLDSMYSVFDGTWSRHSNQEATRLAKRLSDDVTVVGPNRHYFFPCSRAGLEGLFGGYTPLPDEAVSMHLWAHIWWSALRTDHTAFHSGMINEDWIRNSDCTYARAARPFLP